jgi:hypothetical protein
MKKKVDSATVAGPSVKSELVSALCGLDCPLLLAKKNWR